VLFDTTQLALERTIQGAEQRHQALAANLANAETPGYQRVDVDFHGALAAAMQPSRGAAEIRSSLQAAAFAPQADTTAGATRADGSSVDVDAESAKLAANALDQQAAVQVAQARLHIIESAIGAR
jgi:flagellar basal-body rod protein FlgB